MIKKAILFLIVFTFFCISLTYAADYYAIANGASTCIDEHSQQHKITNNVGATLFISTKTASEWSSCWGTAGCDSVSGISVDSCASLLYIGNGVTGAGTTPTVNAGEACSPEGSIAYDSWTFLKSTTYYTMVCTQANGMWVPTYRNDAFSLGHVDCLSVGGMTTATPVTPLFPPCNQTVGSFCQLYWTPSSGGNGTYRYHEQVCQGPQ